MFLFAGSPSLVTEEEGDGFVLSGRLRPSTGRARDGRTGELVRGKRSAQLSTHEMAGLLRHWLLDKGHLEVNTIHSHTHTQSTVRSKLEFF